MQKWDNETKVKVWLLKPIEVGHPPITHPAGAWAELPQRLALHLVNTKQAQMFAPAEKPAKEHLPEAPAKAEPETTTTKKGSKE